MRMIPADMDGDDEKGKLFVGGLSWETTQENLQRYFQRYGEVIDCVVMKNNESGRSRGFGFVTFSDPVNVSIVLQNGPHNLDGRTIDPKPCNPRTLQKPKKGGGYPKVFLGGLPSNVTETDLRVFFGRYGKVMEVVIMYDQEKKKSRGFGFLSFEDDASVDRVTNEHYINLNGKQVEIKKAEPRDGSGGGGGGGGGGMGGNGSIGGGGGNGIGGSGPGLGSGGGGEGRGGGGPGLGGPGNKLNNDNSQWGPPQGAPMSMMQGPNGQMGGPPMNMAISGPNMMQGYQGWGSSPAQQQSYGYGTPNAPGSYQGWPPGPQGPPPHQWSNYAAAPPQQTQGYSSYDMYNSSTGPNCGGGGGGGAAGGGSAAAANWNSWNMAASHSNSTGGTGGSNEMYSRGQSGSEATGGGSGGGSGGGIGMPPGGGVGGPLNNSSKSGSDYGNYGSGYGNYSNDQQSSYGGVSAAPPPRSYSGATVDSAAAAAAAAAQRSYIAIQSQERTRARL